jgi:hypothetical protein
VPALHSLECDKGVQLHNIPPGCEIKRK